MNSTNNTFCYYIIMSYLHICPRQISLPIDIKGSSYLISYHKNNNLSVEMCSELHLQCWIVFRTIDEVENDDKTKGTYISFHLLGGPAGEQPPGVGLQQNHGVPLTPPILPGQVTPELGLEKQRRLPLLLVLVLHLAGPHPGLQPGQTQLDLGADSQKHLKNKNLRNCGGFFLTKEKLIVRIFLLR